jgi:hypothetical protein
MFFTSTYKGHTEVDLTTTRNSEPLIVRHLVLEMGERNLQLAHVVVLSDHILVHDIDTQVTTENLPATNETNGIQYKANV